MERYAQVVIVGGGIVGCSIAYHLTRMGCTDVVIVEKGQLTSGSTWHAAGLVGQLRAERNVTRMLQYSVALYARLEADTGLATGWKQTGCLHLAKTAARLMELKKGASVARSFGLDMHLITPAEAQSLFPLMQISDLTGAAFMPTDGQADPSGITQSLAKGARSRGCRIYEDTLVTGFDTRRRRVRCVKTSRGDIDCETVVNCTGMWAWQVGRLLGVNTPVVPFQHQFLVTHAIEGMPENLPTVRDKDNLLYYKKEVGGLVMGGYEKDGIAWSVNGVANDFTARLLQPDFDHFQSLSEPAMARTPCLEKAGIARLVNGPEGFTPDGDPIMGPAPELDNCFVAAGFNAFGIAAAGGAGRMLAEWIVEGAPSLDIWPLDIRRFGPHHRSRQYCVQRTAELYGKHYTIHWPHEEHRTVRGIRKSPLYSHLVAKGAVFGQKYGWERPNWFAPDGVAPQDEPTFDIPNWFDHVAREHQSVREQVALIDQSSFGKFEVCGSGALGFLNRLCANQIDRPVGSVVYTQMCNEKGTIECDLTVARTASQAFLLVVGTAFARRAVWWMNRSMPQDGSVVLREVTSAYAVINVTGPRSRDLLCRCVSADLSADTFAFSTCRHITVGCAPVLALRITYVGELGYELYVPTEFAVHVYDMLWQAGRDLGVADAGYRAIASLHLEKGYADWGSELTPEYTPFDAGLGRCVALEKENFMGKEALAAASAHGPRWQLCTFTLETQKPVMTHASAPILFDGRVLGVTTNSGFGYTVGKTICYGYLATADAEPQEGFEIEIYQMRYAARRAARRALYDPQRRRIVA